MAKTITALVDTQRAEFVEAGSGPRYMRVTVPRNPDPGAEKYGTTADPFVSKTPAEKAAYKAALDDAVASSEIDTARALKAAMICGLWGRLNRQPTAPEIAAERERFVAIFKTLG